MEFTVDSAVHVLARTPATLRAWLHDLPESWTSGDEGPDTFTPWDVVGHLIQGEEKDWIARARIILESGATRPFEPFDRRAHRRLYAGEPMNRLLDRFERLRAENLVTLRAWALDGAALDRPGRHAELGDVTMRQLLATWVVHDLGHIAQIARVMAKQYTTEVGAWQAYLPVLHDRVIRGVPAAGASS